MMYASLAITDCKCDTLKKVGRANPWHIEALRMITGSEERAHQPLEEILDKDFGLNLDFEIDISGITKGGQFLDTQGYIAHNEETIVLAFRCTTSAFDWLTNFNTTSSAWEVKEDSELGYSGFCSGFDDFCCTGGEYKPRVHTGFYNNFLASLPDIKKHIDPLLGENQPPRTLYVVGHSLGAGIATLAGCYFMSEEYDWKGIPQRLVVVTAGSPRACCVSMKTVIDERRKILGSKCRMYRLVKGKDIVTTLPPKVFGFTHLIDPIKISDDGRIALRTKEADPETDLLALTKFTCVSMENVTERGDGEDNEEVQELSTAKESKYDKFVSNVPAFLRDHMPDFYLKPIFRSRGITCGSLRDKLGVNAEEAPPTTEDDPTELTFDEDEHPIEHSTTHTTKSKGKKKSKFATLFSCFQARHKSDVVA